MEKEFSYKGYNLNIKVEFDISHSRKRMSSITINDTSHSGNYYNKKEVKTITVVDEVKILEADAKRYIDDREEEILKRKSPEVRALIAIGFTED